MIPWEIDGLVTEGEWSSWAVFSPCGRYRYALGRCWDSPPDGRGWTSSRTVLSVVMLNPSTADHKLNDRTVSKCIHFARQEGCGGLLVRNLGAFRATSPRDLACADDPVGPRNIDVLRRQPGAALRVAAWGRLTPKLERLLREPVLQCVCVAEVPKVFALTKDGVYPRHPLYLPNATRVKSWHEAESEHHIVR